MKRSLIIDMRKKSNTLRIGIKLVLSLFREGATVSLPNIFHEIYRHRIYPVRVQDDNEFILRHGMLFIQNKEGTQVEYGNRECMPKRKAIEAKSKTKRSVRRKLEPLEHSEYSESEKLCYDLYTDQWSFFEDASSWDCFNQAISTTL
jgi:hypothetical protein